MKEQVIPLVGSPTTRVSSGVPVYNYDQRFINCFPITIKNPITGQGSVRLNKRQGYSLYQTLASSGFLGNPGTCMWTGYSGGAIPVFSVSNISTAKVRIYDNSGTQIGGDISNAYYCTSLTETKISGVAHLVAYIHDNAIPTVIRAYYFPEGGAWTEITDADFPPNFGTPVSLIGDPIHQNGVMISNGTGPSPAYAQIAMQERGRLLVEPGEEIYEGQIVGIHSKDNDLTVNALRAKQLTNFRASGKDFDEGLTPAIKFSLEQSLEFIADDELVEVTPIAIRLRKKERTENDRKKANRG